MFKFNDNNLKKIYIDGKYDRSMSYEDFKKFAEKFADELINKVFKDDVKDDEVIKE